MSLILVRYGEVALKAGPARRRFESKLMANLGFSLRRDGIKGSVEKSAGRILAKVPEDSLDAALATLSKVFGVVSLSPVTEIEFSGLSDLSEKCASLVERPANFSSFAVRPRRVKSCQFDSVEIGKEVGSAIWKVSGAKVDLSSPEREFFVECRSDSLAYFFTGQVKGPGGLPWATQGKVLCMLGKERQYSALSSFLICRRGCTPIFSAIGEESAAEAAEQLSRLFPYFGQESVRLLVLDAESQAEAAALGLGCEAISFPDRDSKERAPLEIPVFEPVKFLKSEELASLQKTFLPGQVPLVMEERPGERFREFLVRRKK